MVSHNSIDNAEMVLVINRAQLKIFLHLQSKTNFYEYTLVTHSRTNSESS